MHGQFWLLFVEILNLGREPEFIGSADPLRGQSPSAFLWVELWLIGTDKSDKFNQSIGHDWRDLLPVFSASKIIIQNKISTTCNISYKQIGNIHEMAYIHTHGIVCIRWRLTRGGSFTRRGHCHGGIGHMTRWAYTWKDINILHVRISWFSPHLVSIAAGSQTKAKEAIWLRSFLPSS